MLSEFLRKLLLAGQASFTEGEIRILQKSFYMQPIFDIITFQHDTTKITDKLYKNGKTTSKDLVVHFNKIGITEKPQLLRIWMNFINMFGIAELEIVKINEKAAVAKVRAKKSSFAKEYFTKYGKQKKPVDFILSGALAGFFSKYLGRDVDCSETNCVAKGEFYCQFSID